MKLKKLSGLDLKTGTAYSPIVQAIANLPLSLPKRGLLKPGAFDFVGSLSHAGMRVLPEPYAIAFVSELPDLFYKSTLILLQQPDTI